MNQISNTGIDSFLDTIKKDTDNLDTIRNDPKLAIPYFMVDDENPSLRIVNAPFHNEMQDHITENRLNFVVCPRGHAKTSQVTIGRVLYEIGQNPNIRIAIFTEEKGAAKERIDSIKKYITESERYQRLFPHIKPSKTNWSAFSITIERDSFAKDPTVSAIGAYSATTGARKDLIICDDICCEEALRSEKARESIKTIFKNTIVNLLTPKGKLIYIATPFHFDDLTMELMRNAHLRGFAPFIRTIDHNFTPIWKEKFSRQQLIELRNIIESGAFSRGYHCEPLADEESTFSIAKIKSSMRMLPDEDTDIAKHIGVGNNWIKVMGVDPAISKSVRADYTVITVLGIHPEKYYKVPLEIVRAKLDSTETGAKIIELQDKWNCQGIRVENAFYQKSLTQWTQVLSPKPLPFSNIEGKVQQKYARFQQLAVEVKNDGFMFYCHKNPIPEYVFDGKENEKCTCGHCSLISEMATHPLCKHDDCPDSLQLASSLANELINPSNQGGFDVWRRKKRR